MKFLLTSVADPFGDREILEYIDKLRKSGFDVYSETPDVTKRYRDHYIYVNSIEDLMKLIDTVEYEVVISRSYKGDPPCIQIYDNYREVQGFHIEIKPSTKREEMWENILSASQDPPVDIKVAKQDIKAFLKELQDHIPKARWNGSDCLVTEYTNPYWFNHDYIYFALFRYNDKGNLRISYDEIKHSWINKPVIEYIAPMRWDLFKKGRLAVKVTYENYKAFYDACEKELGKKPSTMYCGDFTVSICKKDGYFEIFTMEDQKKTGRKIVNWEDVR